MQGRGVGRRSGATALRSGRHQRTIARNIVRLTPAATTANNSRFPWNRPEKSWWEIHWGNHIKGSDTP
jgi:hypothetical protein